MDIIQALKEELQIGRNQVEAAVKLIDEGNTIPFIARYRKEATGSLNDEVLRQLDERLRYLRNLEDKKEQVIGAIRAQEKLTPALEKQIRDAATLVGWKIFIFRTARNGAPVPELPVRKGWNRWQSGFTSRKRAAAWRRRRRSMCRKKRVLQMFQRQ